MSARAPSVYGTCVGQKQVRVRVRDGTNKVRVRVRDGSCVGQN